MTAVPPEGGTSRVRLVAQLGSSELGRPVAIEPTRGHIGIGGALLRGYEGS